MRKPSTRRSPATPRLQRPAKAERPARAERSAARRSAVLAAALDEFSARGFDAARLDDVARRAGVAKGTIYLYFADKEALFQELVRAEISPFVARIEAARASDMPLRVIADVLITNFVREVFATRRQDIIRLIISEGRRFPKVAEFYYREVVARAIMAVRALLRRAIERGEISNDAIVQFPQLIVAPALMAVVWKGLFERFEPLDVETMLRRHFEILFDGLERKKP